MKRKDSKKFFIRKNRNGYWERGGDSEKELVIAVSLLGIIVLVLGADILTKLFWG